MGTVAKLGSDTPGVARLRAGNSETALCQLINQSIYFTRRVTGWSLRTTTRVIKVCCTNCIYLQIKTQNNFKLKHRYLIVVQAYIKRKKKKQKTLAIRVFGKIKCMQASGKQYSIKATRIQFMQFTIR